ncbi:hypothetical protein L249_7146 [Ophiocordyceps polyrhachis-furcata BCC 54312]|uniref:Peptidyl-prolyl cis-trans isomerase-like 3 n=1 Tax=Ophiocordyceps polyrhachis-furcata BCC 54312 TaxID=1330021 RepID=A0A367LBH9_9HYPO|nr:hypothetical protein L249_7146 [Ophiocordyceps polyrhachis-furcata BCC 54312]
MSVTLHTSLGDLKIEIFCESVPKTAENFLALCASGYYNGSPFHRLIPQFMSGTSIWSTAFDDEIRPSLTHASRGIVSMANKGPATNGSQFFITFDKAPHLDGLNTVFGRLIGDEALATLANIEAVAVDAKNRPKVPFCIDRVTIHANPLADSMPPTGFSSPSRVGGTSLGVCHGAVDIETYIQSAHLTLPFPTAATRDVEQPNRLPLATRTMSKDIYNNQKKKKSRAMQQIPSGSLLRPILATKDSQKTVPAAASAATFIIIDDCLDLLNCAAAFRVYIIFAPCTLCHPFQPLLILLLRHGCFFDIKRACRASRNRRRECEQEMQRRLNKVKEGEGETTTMTLPNLPRSMAIEVRLSCIMIGLASIHLLRMFSSATVYLLRLYRGVNNRQSRCKRP